MYLWKLLVCLRGIAPHWTQPLATMFPKPFLILAAVPGCCYAQQAAADVATGLDGIAQLLADAKAVVKAVTEDDEEEIVVRSNKGL